MRRGSLLSRRQLATQYRLGGTKQFASGLGVVAQAVVSLKIDGEPGVQLAIVKVGDLPRQDGEPWDMAGMQATASGHYDFDAVTIGRDRLIGEPDDYFTEPYFEGGVWRYCAVHCGGAMALYRGFRAHLIATERSGDPFQRERLVSAAQAVRTMQLMDCRRRA